MDGAEKKPFKAGCRRCEGLSSDQKCRRYIEVEEQNVEEFEGCVLTSADDLTDRLPPLVISYVWFKFFALTVFTENEKC